MDSLFKLCAEACANALATDDNNLTVCSWWYDSLHAGVLSPKMAQVVRQLWDSAKMLLLPLSGHLLPHPSCLVFTAAVTTVLLWPEASSESPWGQLGYKQCAVHVPNLACCHISWRCKVSQKSDCPES